ncbi:hypothetical protein [Brevundimonas sp.]|uniref:hypothetical protein n=1 Tax=Brevundimonas sp. TaxID=1871086 RepID=UPI0025FC3666|nr:hypothetical protein [Brevundimonas sp.]
MSAPVTTLEALEDLVDQLAGSSFTDREGRTLESTQVYRTAVQVLEDRRPREASSFQPTSRSREDRSRH